MKTINLDSGLVAACNFEDLTAPLPTVFYFTLSKEASLSIDPFNQFTNYLSLYGIRVISFDLPFHTDLNSFHKAIDQWSEHLLNGHDILTPFFEKVSQSIDELIEKKLIDKEYLAVAGLSRGAFVACHIAAINPHISTILGFAPLTCLGYIKEFHNTSFNSLDLTSIIPKLIGKQLRFYIGNQDLRVGTEKCFEFVFDLAKANREAKIRPNEVELFIELSQGHQGHGTLPPTFEKGALWLQNIIKTV
jgi:hypothetical protein